MANDIDMWNDLECMDKRTNEFKLLSNCFNYRYNEFDELKSEELKSEFEKNFGYWGGYY